MVLGVIVMMYSLIAGAEARAPHDLSNFQGMFSCNQGVRVGRPKTYDQVAQLVKMYPHVMATGMGHSWNKEQFCSGTSIDSVNIMMADVSPKTVFVNETAATVRVSAGLTTRHLLDYLARYRSVVPESRGGPGSLGYTLPAFPWYIDQSIGGALATGSHGSSMGEGSIASQVVAVTVALANGTVMEITAADHPHLMRAWGVSIGRLGILLDLTLKISHNVNVRRSNRVMPSGEFVQHMKDVQRAYNTNGESAQAVQDLGEHQLFWYFPNDELMEISFDSDPATWPVLLRSQGEGPEAGPNPLYAAMQERFAATTLPEAVAGAVGSTPQSLRQFEQTAMDSKLITLNTTAPKLIELDQLQNFLLVWGLGARDYSTFSRGTFANLFPTGVYSRRHAYISEPEGLAESQAELAIYDQYEVAVPLDRIGDCVETLQRAMNDPRNPLRDGFPIPGLVRYVKSEPFYLSPTNGGPRVYFNLEDYYSHSGRYDSNAKFEAAMKILRSDQCQGRLHWGKAGWPQYAKRFDGGKEFGDSWCHFGCAVRELDPQNKFAGLSDVWSWEGVDLERCCGPDGFSAQCKCDTQRSA